MKKHTDKQGQEREYRSAYLRRSFRSGGKVMNETVANLSALPWEVIASIEAGLKGEHLVPAGSRATITRSLPHGHVAAVTAQANALGLPALLGPACPAWDIALALIVARVCRPGSKLFTKHWWTETALVADLDLAAASTDQVYAGMDWLAGRREIEYGLLTDPNGRPVAVRVVAGNTADPKAFENIARGMKTTFNLQEMVMVGDRGMITSARIEALKELGGLGWVTALRAPAIKALAEERARKRTELLAATEPELAKIVAAVAAVDAGRLRREGPIGVGVGMVVGKYRMEKHFKVAIADHRFLFTRRQESFDAEAALDGIYVIRTTVPATRMYAAKVVTTYKSMANVERDFRSIKPIDLSLRPIHHYTETQVRAHVFICMLAAYLLWHLRQAWAPLTFTDEDRPEPADPVAPAKRSDTATAKASTGITAEGRPAMSFRSLLEHLATLTRNDLRYGPGTLAIPTLAEPTLIQRRAFELLDRPIPLTLK